MAGFDEGADTPGIQDLVRQQHVGTESGSGQALALTNGGAGEGRVSHRRLPACERRALVRLDVRAQSGARKRR